MHTTTNWSLVKTLAQLWPTKPIKASGFSNGSPLPITEANLNHPFDAKVGWTASGGEADD
jgi:hypothetical protein